MSNANCPQWGYRLKDGEIEAVLFEEGRPEKGWEDSPAKCTKPAPKKRGRPKKDA